MHKKAPIAPGSSTPRLALARRPAVAAQLPRMQQGTLRCLRQAALLLPPRKVREGTQQLLPA